MRAPAPPPKKRERLSPEQRREQLIGAAVTAYSQQGVERAGHGDIAKLTSASTATVFNYFPTREALTEAVLDHVTAQLLDAISLTDDTMPRSAAEVLAALLLRFNALIEDEPDIIKVMLNWSVSFSATVRPQYLVFQDNMLDLLQAAIGGPLTGAEGERAEARLIHAAAISYATMKLDKTSDIVIGEFVNRVIRIFK